MAVSDFAWHPFTVAVTTFVATATFFMTVVVPIHNVSLQNKISDQDKEIAELRKESTELKKVEENPSNLRTALNRISQLERERSDLRTKLGAAQLPNVFEKNNPFPVGLRQVKLGDNIDAVHKAFPNSIIESDRGDLRVKAPHSLIKEVRYLVSTNKSIHAVFFIVETPLEGDVLQLKLVEALGEPKTGTKKNCYQWRLASNFFVRKADSQILMVSTSDLGCREE